MESPKNEKGESYEVWKWLQKYVTFVYKHPYAVLLVCLAFLGGAIGWLFGVYGFTVDAVIPDYRWFGGSDIDKWDSFINARNRTYYSTIDKESKTIEENELSEMIQLGVIVYERRGKNILDVEVLREIWRLEDRLYNYTDWDKYCFKPNATSFAGQPVHKDPRNGCMYFQSLIVFLKDLIKFRKWILNPTPEDLDESIVQYALQNELLVASFMGRDAGKTNYSEVLRSMVSLGTPQKGYYNAVDRADEQATNAKNWGLGFLKPMKELSSNNTVGLKVFPYIPGPIDVEIANCIIKQVLWLIGSFGFLIVFSIIHMRSAFVSILGVLGIFFSIPCSIITMKGIIQIEHFDALNVIGLFLICGIGSDCMFILYDLVRQTAHMEGRISHEQRLGWATQHGLIALATSLSTAAVAFLALTFADFRVMQFFGIFCFFELFYDFVFTFTWYIAVLAIFMKHFEGKFCQKKKAPIDYKPLLETQSLQSVDSVKSLQEYDNDYPLTKWYDCFIHKPAFNVKSAGLEIEAYSGYERFFHNYVAPIVYFYRVPICIIFLALTITMGYFTMQMQTSFEIQFLSNEHPLQRGYTLLQNDFATSFMDFSLIYVWGTDGTVKPSLRDRLTSDSFGRTNFVDTNVSLPEVQQAMLDACDILENDSTLIDHAVKSSLVCPIRLMRNFYTDKVGHFPVQPDELKKYLGEFQDNLSTSIGEGEPTVELWKGANTRDLIGFSFENGSLMYIAMKANMQLPPDRSSDSLRVLYNKGKALMANITAKFPEWAHKGYQTSQAWVQMVTQDKVGVQALIDVCASIGFASLCIFISTLSISYTLLVAYSMFSTVITIIGILYLNGWSIGVKEAVMISIAAGYSSDFIIQPMLAMAHDTSGLSVFGKLQRSITMFAAPVSSALCTTVAAAAFLFPSEIIIFSPFATFLCMSGGFGILYGFVVLPALIAWIAPKKSDSLKLCCKKKEDI